MSDQIIDQRVENLAIVILAALRSQDGLYVEIPGKEHDLDTISERDLQEVTIDGDANLIALAKAILAAVD